MGARRSTCRWTTRTSRLTVTPSRPVRNLACITRPAARSTTTPSPKSGCPAKKSRKPTASSRPTKPGTARRRCPALYLADHGDDLAEHGRVVAGDGIERRVVRHQPYLTARTFERLDGCLAVDHGRNDVAVVGDMLLSHDHPVVVADRGFDH